MAAVHSSGECGVEGQDLTLSGCRLGTKGYSCREECRVNFGKTGVIMSLKDFTPSQMADYLLGGVFEGKLGANPRTDQIQVNLDSLAQVMDMMRGELGWGMDTTFNEREAGAQVLEQEKAME